MTSIPEALTTAVNHHREGRLQAAEDIYRQILAVDPNQADTHHLLGLVALQSGKPELAAEHIQRAIGLKESVFIYHYNAAEAYRVLGRFSEAIAGYRRALALKPDYAEAHNSLGVAFKDQGMLEEAAACYRQALFHKPDYAEAHNNLGNVFKDQGQIDEAIACYRRALALKSNYAEAHNNLGVALSVQGKFDETLACYRMALQLKPDYGEAYNNLGNLLKQQGKMDEAVACYSKALGLHPNSVRAHSNLGNALQEMGDFAGAEASYRAALRYNPRFASAYYKLAEILGRKLPDEDLTAMRRLLAEGKLPDAERLFLHYGLGQSLDAKGEFAEAAEQLAQANALHLDEWRLRGQEYDPQAHAEVVTRVIELCSPEFFARVHDCGLEDESPVFVLGLPRSGTTLVEQILASHSQVVGAGELTLIYDTAAALCEPGTMFTDLTDFVQGMRRMNAQAALPVAARHLQRLRALAPRACLRIVDKSLENYLFLGILASLFPRAKFIHCRRDLRDVAVSIWITRFFGLRWACDQEHIASRLVEYRRLMDHWRNVLPTPMLEVDYEETVSDVESVARRLVEWCGLEWEPGCLAFHRAKRPVSTASAVQVRQPIYKTSVGRWKNYERALEKLFAKLEGEGLS